MRRLTLIAFAACLCAAAAASAETSTDFGLTQVLVHTYENNPTLRAARAELMSTYEITPQALAGRRPSVGVSADISRADIEQTTFGSGGLTSKSMGLSLTQPLYRGGRTTAGVRGAEYTVRAAVAEYAQTEQSVLLAGIQAYLDVYRDQQIVELRKNNESVLSRHLNATKKRLEVGEKTRTDVSQAESRLADAAAGTIQARGQLASSRAFFEQIAGLPVPPDGIALSDNSPGVPETLEEAMSVAEQNNPAILAVGYIQKAAEENIGVAEGELLPEISLDGGLSRAYDPLPGFTKQQDIAQIGLSASLPLYKGGSVQSRIREAKHTANQRRIEIEEAHRDIRRQAADAWQVLETARAVIKARHSQVQAAELALSGVEQEMGQGTRTTLDNLDAEQELLAARVAEVSAQRDAHVAAYGLLAVMGGLTAKNLRLPVEYFEMDQNYEHTKRALFSTGVDAPYDTSR